ncbi:MAG: pre-rRNA-processing protein TSR3 [Myxococcota bacterium]|jgi:pre-rRNA-processing protein TSR3
MHKTIIIRLNKESPKKCSLTPIRKREDLDIEWHHCNIGNEVQVGSVTLLHPEGQPLTKEDDCRPLLLVDSSWRDLPKMLATVRGNFELRCLPKNLVTAYPRKSKTYEDPETGLASIEALHAATVCLGRRDDSLLEGYYFADKWLQMNDELNNAD